MTLRKVLVANRGEIAIRVMRAAAELRLSSVAVFSEDDARCLHTRKADEARALAGQGTAAYLDIDQLLSVARDTGCDAVHPGYGFLSESAELARRCDQAGLRFVGPSANTLALLGDKARARALASQLDIPVPPGASAACSLAEARAFFAALAPGEAMLLKAIAGGGGRGMRVVRAAAELESAYARCESEARAAFGDGSLYVERLVERARHIEVQVIGDRSGAVSHLWERECSLQRRHQKLVEIAPSPSLEPALRERMLEAALRLARAARVESLTTVEFLVEAGRAGEPRFMFIEANPRLQVEHTVTEEVTGVDLVKLQLRLAAGSSLKELGLGAAPPVPRGFAVQVRVNMEQLDAAGGVVPTGGTLEAFDVPTGAGVRVESLGYAGYTSSPSFDSLLAKLIAHDASPAFGDVMARVSRALSEFRIVGVPTNLEFLRALLAHEDVLAHRVYTRFVDDQLPQLLAAAQGNAPLRHLEFAPAEVVARVDAALSIEGDALVVPAPMQGRIVSIGVSAGESVRAGAQLAVLEAMKMEHVIEAPEAGVVLRVGARPGDTVRAREPLFTLERGDGSARDDRAEHAVDLDQVRSDLAAVIARHAYGLDENRAEAVKARKERGHRTARENIAALIDPGSFVEYGPLVVAAQRRRRLEQDLIQRTPADGLIAGVARVNGELFDAGRTECIVMSYDYMVLAGTQGTKNHQKKDRMFELAERARLPVVFFTEGGGGRPGDTDSPSASGLDCLAFWYFGKLSGLVPLVGIANGRCFAGNAAILGACDVVIATEDSNIGMGGPAMIEGGGLGVFRPEEIGPASVQVPNGVIDVLVKDELEAAAVAKKYLGYFQGTLSTFEVADQRRLRSVIPENRLRVYDVRHVIDLLCDQGTVLELRRAFGPGMVTALARVEGRALGIIANNPLHLSGAIDREGADKAARFMQLCDAFDLPILFLCDTPGIMVGPDAEKTAMVRHAARLFVTAGSLSVPFFTIVLRKGYGLGAQAMAGGSFKAPFFTIGWPTSEFGPMGLEGAVRLGFRKELEAIADPAARKQAYDAMVQAAYAQGRGTNVASHFELDDIIDPADSRRWISCAMRAAPPPPPRQGKKRPCVDTW